MNTPSAAGRTLADRSTPRVTFAGMGTSFGLGGRSRTAARPGRGQNNHAADRRRGLAALDHSRSAFDRPDRAHGPTGGGAPAVGQHHPAPFCRLVHLPPLHPAIHLADAAVSGHRDGMAQEHLAVVRGERALRCAGRPDLLPDQSRRHRRRRTSPLRLHPRQRPDRADHLLGGDRRDPGIRVPPPHAGAGAPRRRCRRNWSGPASTRRGGSCSRISSSTP